MITPQDIKALREETGVGMMEAKKALAAADGDRKLAIEALRKAGTKIAAAKSARQVKEGTIGYYVHANHKVAALVALACETDFVARTDDFKNLAHDLAIHVAAANPLYLQPSDVPANIVAKEEEVYRAQLQAAGKPEKMWDKILPGKLQKYFAEICLLEQPFVKDDKIIVKQLLESSIAKLGENIQVTSFSRLLV